MRTLVEQTVKRIREQHERLGLDIAVHQMMGGIVESDWVDRGEDDAVLVGTLDQLFSRAVMRGYGESRFRWSIDYGFPANTWGLTTAFGSWPGEATRRQLPA